MVTEKLSRSTVAERAVALADAEGTEAVTIRRLAQELGVTPMALYWHFKSKEELLYGVVDHMLADVKASRNPDDPWRDQIRAMVEALVGVMRAHPVLPTLMHAVDKHKVASFTRATNDALELLCRAGFGVEEAYWISGYLLQGAMGLVSGEPGCPATMTPEEATEWRRQRRLELEALPVGQYPKVVEFAQTLREEPDIARYYRFGIDLLVAGVVAMAGAHSG